MAFAGVGGSTAIAGAAGPPTTSTGLAGTGATASCDAASPDSDGDGTPDCMDQCPTDANKTMPGVCGCGVAEAVAGASGAVGCLDPNGPAQPDAGTSAIDPNRCQVADIPDALRQDYDLDPFYTRYADAEGIPIISSDSPVDEALTRACLIVIDMSSGSAAVRQELLDQKIRFIMMGADEKTVDTPDFRSLGDLDWRARGLGGIPAALCAEENVMCDTATDRWRGESICVHEYSHTVHMAGFTGADSTFNNRLRDAFDSATGMGLFANTYAASQTAEYFAEGVQDWYNTNLYSMRGESDGVHNQINTRDELRDYDPMLYDLLAEVLPAEPQFRDCYYYE